MKPLGALSPSRVIPLAAFIWLATILGGTAGEWQGHKLADFPTDFIIGYGSLINSASRNSTVSAPIPAIPVRILPSFGYIRSWNSRADAFTSLGLRKAGPGERALTINGVLYPVNSADLPKYDQREEHYHRVEVPASQIEAVGWQRLPEAGHLWTYVPLASDPQGEPDADHPLLQSYIDVVVEGGLEYGEDFAREIVETSDGWSDFWLNDRELARRPQGVLDPKAAAVDVILKKTLSADQLSARVFPEMYSEVVRRAAAK